MTLVDIVYNFLWTSGGGVFLGLSTGLLVVMWLRRITRDDILVNIITFFSCYILYFLAVFTDLKVSGSITLTAYGLFLNAFGKTTIKSENLANVRTVWIYVSTCMGKIITFFSGNIIGILTV